MNRAAAVFLFACLVAITAAATIDAPLSRAPFQQELIQQTKLQQEEALVFQSDRHLEEENDNVSATRQYAEGQEQNTDYTTEEKNDESESLAVVVTFEEIFRLSVFIAASWVMSNLSVACGLPGLVGEIITGFLLGPPLANFCPFPQAMVLIGNFGLLGLMLESGIHLDIAQLKETGTRAVLMAVSGTVLALSAGLALWYTNHVVQAPEGAFPSPSAEFSSAMAVGSSFAPSSLGVAAAVLSSGNVLNTPIGQLIVASSVVDDVLGLILLALLKVFATENPTIFNYIQPFLASFGFLAILGYLGVAWIPRIIQNGILPRVPPEHREKTVFAIMFSLMLAYMPLLDYAGASYLTGTFLAGLSVSQVPDIQQMYKKNGQELMVWLMRCFFTATIGFQIPILRYGSVHVLTLAAKFLVPVLAKLPLGLMVPTFTKEVPKGFPFKPFRRDAFITSLSVMCRGEFNVVVASFGLSQGLLSADVYSAIVMAILVSSIIGPLLLSQAIRHYNHLSDSYFSKPHVVKRIKNTRDGYRPLFVAIQIRTPASWSLHEKFQHALQDLGMMVLDHRTWHTNGLEAVAMSEIFVRDTLQNVTVKNCFDENASTGSVCSTSSSESGNQPKDVCADIWEEMTAKDTIEASFESGKACPFLPWSATEDRQEKGRTAIEARLAQVQAALESCLGDVDPAEYVIQTKQWEPFLQTVGKGHKRQRTYTFQETPASVSSVGKDHRRQQTTAIPEIPTEIFADIAQGSQKKDADTLCATTHEAKAKESSSDNVESHDGCKEISESHNVCLANNSESSTSPRSEHSTDIANTPEEGPNKTSFPSNQPPQPLRKASLGRSASLGVHSAHTSTRAMHPQRHRRIATHGNFDRQLIGDTATPMDVKSISKGHRRNVTHGQCYGILIGEDLWETDEVAQGCDPKQPRRGSFFAMDNSFRASGSVGGSIQEQLDDGQARAAFESNGQVTDRDLQFISLLRSSHDQPTAVQQHLQGYVRHCGT